MTTYVAVVDHIAWLTPSISSFLDSQPELYAIALEEDGSPKGLEFDEFESEQTRELYVGNDFGSKLLLQEPLDPSNTDAPYAKALAKRGPGLHHIALRVTDTQQFVSDFAASAGWFLHPKSLALYTTVKTVFLCRPGVPFLLEVFQASETVEETNGYNFVKEIRIAQSVPETEKYVGCLAAFLESCGGTNPIVRMAEVGEESSVLLHNGVFLNS